jgi:septal ring factor EnvC (AmiA/AmiB activator)
MPDVSKPKTNAEKLTKHRVGIATTLRRIEDRIEDLTATIVALQRQLPEKHEQEKRQ